MIYIDVAMAIKALAAGSAWYPQQFSGAWPSRRVIEVELSPALMCREFCAISVYELYMMFLFTLIYIYLFNNIYIETPQKINTHIPTKMMINVLVFNFYWNLQI
jgi:hypothetical protein